MTRHQRLAKDLRTIWHVAALAAADDRLPWGARDLMARTLAALPRVQARLGSDPAAAARWRDRWLSDAGQYLLLMAEA